VRVTSQLPQKATSRQHPQKHYMHAIASSVQETATREKQFPRVFQVPLSFSSRNSNYYKNTPNFRNNSENTMTKREIFHIWG
jgi:hypothetical protein